jgi:hypothetical protein
VQACAQLHNYCINNHDDNIPIIFNHNPKTFAPNFEAFYPPVYALIITQASGCASREAIRSQVASDGYCRPAYNISYNSLSFTSDNGKQEINFYLMHNSLLSNTRITLTFSIIFTASRSVVISSNLLISTTATRII